MLFFSGGNGDPFALIGGLEQFKIGVGFKGRFDIGFFGVDDAGCDEQAAGL